MGPSAANGRRVLWRILWVLFVALIVGYFALWLTERRAGVNWYTAEQIRPGMTRPQVKAIVGVPPTGGEGSNEGGGGLMHWGTDLLTPGSLNVWFDRTERVRESEYVPSDRLLSLDTLHGWLGWVGL